MVRPRGEVGRTLAESEKNLGLRENCGRKERGDVETGGDSVRKIVSKGKDDQDPLTP